MHALRCYNVFAFERRLDQSWFLLLHPVDQYFQEVGLSIVNFSFSWLFARYMSIYMEIFRNPLSFPLYLWDSVEAGITCTIHSLSKSPFM